MALGGIVAGLNTSTPSGTSQAGLGPQDFQSVKTTFQQVLDSEHNFPSTGGAGSGAHRLGSARAFVGTASQVSSSDTDGRFMITSDTSRLYHVSSATTMLLGSRFAVEMTPSGVTIGGTATASKVTQVYRMEAGQFVMTSTGTVITLQNSYVANTVTGTVCHSGTSLNFSQVPVFGGVNTNQLTVYSAKVDGTGQTSVGTYMYLVNYMVLGAVAG